MTARTDQGRDGKLIELEGDRVGVRFERRLAHPPERVWRAITEPEDLEKWFPARPEIAGERRVGAELQFTYPEGSEPPETGEVTEYDPPRLFAFTWRSSGRKSQLLRFELEPEEDGCRLVFIHELPRPDTAKVAAGWQLCLDDLETALAGEDPGEFPEGRWVELHESYAEQFGVSPESGRQAVHERQEASQTGVDTRFRVKLGYRVCRALDLGKVLGSELSSLRLFDLDPRDPQGRGRRRAAASPRLRELRSPFHHL